MAEPLLQLKEIILPFPEPPPAINLLIHPGEIWLIDGAAKSGKTTLFKVLSGLIQPRSGTISLFNTNLRTCSARSLARLRQRMGILLEGDGLIPSWSIFDNLALPWRYHDLLPESALQETLTTLLQQFGEEEELLYRVAATLTIEQRRRMALLRAMQNNPQLILLDNDGVASYLDRLMPPLLPQIEAQALALVVRGTPAMARFFPKELLRRATVHAGALHIHALPSYPVIQPLNQ
ncbi:ATP-binding cassette domain-containing protein [Candidatus Magnetaquicoccus inordinatus]|uniref:ATP-binding cassette domain-containing protein n=1 Tax=Candidatus Magnetaquicoccus inordinatus TaxID=2496818 RepID=UPI00102B5408|nr:ATP-binding cassette domain-containing protein [Candidatus Magnetaquicoccus inordinatus]